MAYFLTAFHRTFVAIDGYARTDDREGSLLGGRLGNALHNVPSMLWNQTSDSWYPPEKLDAELQDLPNRLQKARKPDRVAEECRQIVAHAGAAQTLGLREDLADFDLAPPLQMREYLESLYRSCLVLRYMSNYEDRPFILSKHALFWLRDAKAQASYNGYIGATLAPLPIALASWSKFDERTYLKAVFDDAVTNSLRCPTWGYGAIRSIHREQPHG